MFSNGSQTCDITAKKFLLRKDKPDSELLQTPEMACHKLKAAVLNLQHEDSSREFHYGSPNNFHDTSGLCKCTVYGEYSALYHVLFCSERNYCLSHHSKGKKSYDSTLYRTYKPATERTYVPAYLCTYLHTHLRNCTHVHAYTRTHTHKHTRTHFLQQSQQAYVQNDKKCSSNAKEGMSRGIQGQMKERGEH